jgi:hypothetical protein
VLDGIIDFSVLEDAINRAFDRLVAEFEDLQIEQLEAVKWAWADRKTVRSSGQVVGSPRDIVDTGKLRDSLEVMDMGNSHVRYEYGEDYAGLVHQGFDGAGQAGQPVSYPARPWVVGAYEENDLLEIFAEYLAEELG